MTATLPSPPERAILFHRLLGCAAAFASLCVVAVAPARTPLQPPPACWTQPRMFHAGAPAPELAARIRLAEAPTTAPAGIATTSPNGAYRFWLEQPDMTRPGFRSGRLIVDTQGDMFPTLRAVDIDQPLNPRWLNEKLIFLRIALSRTVFTDIIWDVEANELVYQEALHDGTAAYAQAQAACNGRCPCADDAPVATIDRRPDVQSSSATNVPKVPMVAVTPDIAQAPSIASAPPIVEAPTSVAPVAREPQPVAQRAVGTAPAPMSTPGRGESIGLLAIPELFGFGQGKPPAPEATPVTVYASPSAGARSIGEIRKRYDAQYDEIGYEAGAVVVYDVDGDWYEVRLRRDGRRDAFLSGWVRQSQNQRFYTNEELLQDRFGYLNAHWDGRMWSAPNADGLLVRATTAASNDGGGRERAAKILETRNTARGLWVKVALYRNSPCESGDQTVELEGWVPAYSGEGKRVVWYWSRGC